MVFEGKRLLLKIDTDATGYAQVGLTDADGNPIPAFGIGKCIYLNGDFTNYTVEWLDKGTDVSEIAGKVVRVVFRLRGAKLYAFQFNG